MKKYRISLTFEVETEDTNYAIATANNIWAEICKGWGQLNPCLKEQCVKELEEDQVSRGTK